MGKPDLLTVFQVTGYISKEMKEKAEASGIQLIEEPIKSPGSIRIFERYHAPLRAAYKKLRQSLPKNAYTDEDFLNMVIYADNKTMGPESLCAIMQVFGAT